LLEDLKEGCDGSGGWFVGQEMDVLGHEDVGGYTEALLPSDLFEDGVERVFCVFRSEKGLTAVTAEGNEVEVLGLLETF